MRCHIVTVNTMANGNYGRIMNNFMGELLSPLGNTVSVIDLAPVVLRHICLIACVWLAHSLTLTYLDVLFSRLQRIGQGRKWICSGICVTLSTTLCTRACIYKRV